MTVQLVGPAGGVVEVGDDAAERYLALGYTKVKAAPAPKADPDKRRAKPRKGT